MPSAQGPIPGTWSAIRQKRMPDCRALPSNRAVARARAQRGLDIELGQEIASASDRSRLHARLLEE